MIEQATPLVLFVEDDAVLRLHVAERLEASGFPTLHACTASEAIK